MAPFAEALGTSAGALIGSVADSVSGVIQLPVDVLASGGAFVTSLLTGNNMIPDLTTAEEELESSFLELHLESLLWPGNNTDASAAEVVLGYRQSTESPAIAAKKQVETALDHFADAFESCRQSSKRKQSSFWSRGLFFGLFSRPDPLHQVA